MNTATKPSPQEVIAEFGADIVGKVSDYMRANSCHLPHAFFCIANEKGITRGHPRYLELMQAVGSELSRHRRVKPAVPVSRRVIPELKHSFESRALPLAGHLPR